MMFAPRYTVWHCGYLKGEREMSDTPRTDELIYSSVDLSQSTIAEFAQTLERELTKCKVALADRDSAWRLYKEAREAEVQQASRADEAVAENAALREQLKECSAAFDRQQQQLDRNAEQNAALQKDAERYRWLRNDSFGQFVHPIVVSQTRTERGINYIGPVFYESLDAAIDAAKGEGK